MALCLVGSEMCIRDSVSFIHFLLLFFFTFSSVSSSFAPYKIFNIGNSKPVELLYFVELIEKELGIKGIKNLMPIQAGDVEETAANTDLFEKWVDFKPYTPIEIGIKRFIKWFIEYYKI